MARPNSKQSLAEYCLRQCGAPVINIEIDNVQLEDCIDSGLDFLSKNHYAGFTEVVRKITFTARDEAKQTIRMPSNFMTVLELYENNSGGFSGEDFENLNYLLSQSDMWQIIRSGNRDVTSLHMSLAYLKLLKTYFAPKNVFTFNELTSELSVPGARIVEGNFILIRGYVQLDVENDDYEKIWDDMWLKRYCTCLVKMQWCQNLSKYANVVMLGGTSVNVDVMYERARTDMEKLEADFVEKNSMPVDFFWG